MKELTTTSEQLSVLARKLENNLRFGFDVETTSFHPKPKAPLDHDKMIVVGFGLAFPDGDKTYVPLAHEASENANKGETLGVLKKALEDKENEVWAHNLKFEHQAARTMEMEIEGEGRCSQIAQFLLGKSLPGGKGLKLKAAAQEFLGHTMTTWEEVVSTNARAHEVSSSLLGPYCADDALQCLKLGEFWTPQLEEYGMTQVFEELECPFTRVLGHIREVGFALDRDMLRELNAEFSTQISEIEDNFMDLAGVKVSSNAQVSRQMYEVLKWWPCAGLKKGKSGVYPVNEKVRVAVAEQLREGSPGWVALKLKEKHSKIAKLNSTYTFSLADKADSYVDSRLRCDFNQTITATGRLSSSNPNFQNIPKPESMGEIIRQAFISEPGWIICDADYNQADLVMMAHLSRDPMLLKAYNEGIDLHKQTAEACSCDRFTGKTLNLGLIYEMGPGTLAKNLGISMARAKIIHSRWHQMYPMVRAYHARMHAYAKKFGYVKTITGRLRFLPNATLVADKGFSARNRMMEAMALREATNTPDQGSVSDVIKIAMRNLWREWRDRGVLYDYWTKEGKAKIVSQVHDEIICELRDDFAEEGAQDIKRHMETAVELRAPMTAEPGLGSNWLEAKV